MNSHNSQDILHRQADIKYVRSRTQILSDLFEEDGELSVNIKPANISLFQIKQKF